MVSFPNNHLGYAITWFGLALGLAVVYSAFAWRRLNEPQNAKAQGQSKEKL